MGIDPKSFIKKAQLAYRTVYQSVEFVVFVVPHAKIQFSGNMFLFKGEINHLFITGIELSEMTLMSRGKSHRT